MSTDQIPEGHQGGQPLALKSNEGLGPSVPQRESVDDALMIVESYGPWGSDLNDAHRRQIVLADEVLRLRKLYEMAARGRAEMRAALVPHIKTAAEMRRDAAHDTSCVGAFARARPGA